MEEIFGSVYLVECYEYREHGGEVWKHRKKFVNSSMIWKEFILKQKFYSPLSSEVTAVDALRHPNFCFCFLI